MALGFLDRCVFTATTGGTSDYTPASAVTGYLVPADAGAVSGTTYRGFAQSDDLSQWEVFFGAWNGTTFARTTIEFSSNSNNAVNFSAAPKVYMGGPLARDMHWEVLGDTTVSSPVASITHSINPSLYAELRTVAIELENESDIAGLGMSWGWQFQQSDGTVDLDKTQTVVASADSSAGHLGGTIRHYFANRNATAWHGTEIYLFKSDDTVTDSDTIISADFSDTTKIVYFFSDDSSDGSVATASDTTAGRIITYGLRLP